MLDFLSMLLIREIWRGEARTVGEEDISRIVVRSLVFTPGVPEISGSRIRTLAAAEAAK